MAIRNGQFTTLIAMTDLGAAVESFAADAERQAEVGQRGAEIVITSHVVRQQLSDHSADAMDGQMHPHQAMTQP
jgi:hypothetical protein